MAHYGKLSIVVNNAAILVPGDIKTALDRHIELMWGVDLRGPVMLMKYAVPHLIEAGGGNIISITGPASRSSPGPDRTSSPAGAASSTGW